MLGIYTHKKLKFVILRNSVNLLIVISMAVFIPLCNVDFFKSLVDNFYFIYNGEKSNLFDNIPIESHLESAVAPGSTETTMILLSKSRDCQITIDRCKSSGKWYISSVSSILDSYSLMLRLDKDYQKWLSTLEFKNGPLFLMCTFNSCFLQNEIDKFTSKFIVVLYGVLREMLNESSIHRMIGNLMVKLIGLSPYLTLKI